MNPSTATPPALAAAESSCARQSVVDPAPESTVGTPARPVHVPIPVPPTLAKLLFAPGQHPHSIGLILVKTLDEMDQVLDQAGLSATIETPKEASGRPRAACFFHHGARGEKFGYLIFAEETLTPALISHETTHAASAFVSEKVMTSAAVTAMPDDEQGIYFEEALATIQENLFDQAFTALFHPASPKNPAESTVGTPSAKAGPVFSGTARLSGSTPRTDAAKAEFGDHNASAAYTLAATLEDELNQTRDELAALEEKCLQEGRFGSAQLRIEQLQAHIDQLREAYCLDMAMMCDRLQERTLTMLAGQVRAQNRPNAQSFRAGWKAGNAYHPDFNDFPLEEALREHMEPKGGPQ